MANKGNRKKEQDRNIRKILRWRDKVLKRYRELEKEQEERPSGAIGKNHKDTST